MRTTYYVVPIAHETMAQCSTIKFESLIIHAGFQCNFWVRICKIRTNVLFCLDFYDLFPRYCQFKQFESLFQLMLVIFLIYYVRFSCTFISRNKTEQIIHLPRWHNGRALVWFSLIFLLSGRCRFESWVRTLFLVIFWPKISSH